MLSKSEGHGCGREDPFAKASRRLAARNGRREELAGLRGLRVQPRLNGKTSCSVLGASNTAVYGLLKSETGSVAAERPEAITRIAVTRQ